MKQTEEEEEEGINALLPYLLGTLRLQPLATFNTTGS